MSKELGVVLNNIRSCENVGSILRTAEFFGFKHAWFVGVTPYPDLDEGAPPGDKSLPSQVRDERLPHIREKLDKQIKKVSLGAEKDLVMSYEQELKAVIGRLKADGWRIVGLEQDAKSVELDKYKPKNDKIVLVLGTEVTGLDFDDLSLVDDIIEIPRSGNKESLNVSVAFGVAASHLSR